MKNPGTRGKYIGLGSCLRFFSIENAKAKPKETKIPIVYQFWNKVLKTKAESINKMNNMQIALLLFLNCLYKNIGIVKNIEAISV